jgi:membrane fusion protein (multidrug efflux system)
MLSDIDSLPAKAQKPASTAAFSSAARGQPRGEVAPQVARDAPFPADGHPASQPEAPTMYRDQRRSRKGSERVLRASGAALAVVLLGGLGALYWDNASRFETTDDAFIAARQFTVAPKVAGYIAAVPVTDNQHVVTGDVIARVDDRDYRTALAQAEAQRDAAQASIDNVDAQIGVQQAQVAQSVAQMQQQQATLAYDQQQSVRYGSLARDGWGTLQDAQQWNSQRSQGEASLKAASNAVMAAERQLAVLNTQRRSAEANLAQATAERDQARLNLSYTTVTAAQPGRIVQLGAAAGQYAQAGTGLAMFVPDDIWVTGNFKENQLNHMRPGQPVTLRIDAYPGLAIYGHIASVQPGSGTAFSLLPAQNATGNYVKIVQRVPVKIVLDNPPTDVALGPGMSVEPRVRIDASPSLLERLEKAL